MSSSVTTGAGVSTSASSAVTTAGAAVAAGSVGRTTTTVAVATINGKPASQYTPPAGARPATPARPGTYRYDTSGSASFGGQTTTDPPVTSLVVDPPNGVRQHSTRDFRDSQGRGSTTETFLEYQPQGVLLDEVKSTMYFGSGSPVVVDLKAPTPGMVVPTGAKPGDHSEFDLVGSGERAHVVVDVLRHEDVVVDGQSVDTLVVKSVATLSGSFSGTNELDNWVSTTYEVVAKEHSVSDISAGLIKAHAQSDSTLQRLTPA